jgi:hypothetical protein
LLLDWGQLYDAAAQLKGVPPRRFESLTPWSDEVLPGRFALAVPTLLQVLREGWAPDEQLARARTRLDGLVAAGGPPGLEAWRALLALADGEADLALDLSVQLAAQAPDLAPAAAWLQARIHAGRGDGDQACAALRRALDGGLNGALVQDPAFEGLQRDERFPGLAAWARSNDPRSGW